MTSLWKNVTRSVTPPVIWNSALFLKQHLLSRFWRMPHMGHMGENAVQADEHYRTHRDLFIKHYTESPYYFLWCVVADRLMRGLEPPILEIGCGAGQFASMLYDKGIEGYLGIDFSAEAVVIARASCPKCTFLVEDFCATNVLSTLNYSTVVILEVLEHLQKDLEVLKRIRSGTRVFGSVPSFPSTFHVRCFSSCEKVAGRYAELFDEFHVESFGLSGNTNWLYLFEGIRRTQ